MAIAAFHCASLPLRSGRISSNRNTPWKCSAATPAPTTSMASKTAESKITSIKAREILDSRGNPTIEVDLSTALGVYRAAVPSGASTGAYEALELRDGDKSRYGGKGVKNAINNVNQVIAPKLLGADVRDQNKIDDLMNSIDGTHNKGVLGANAILGVSMTACIAGAATSGIPLYQHIANLAGKPSPSIMPVPVFNVINGGQHAGNTLAMQEFMIMPTGAESFAHALRMGAETYAALKNVIKKRYGLDATAVGDEGGFAPNVRNAREGMELLMAAIEQAGFEGKMRLAMDVAASEFFVNDASYYDLDFKNPKSSSKLTAAQLGELYKNLVDEFPIVSIEDPFNEDDWAAYSKLTGEIGGDIQIVGDDLTVTNVKRIERAARENCVNALLLKINQIGSISEAIQASNMAQKAGWGVMVSHRSGETEDTFIADLVVGLGVGQAKLGATCRSERLAKYNQLLRIEEQLGDNAVYAGKHFRNPGAMFS